MPIERLREKLLENHTKPHHGHKAAKSLGGGSSATSPGQKVLRVALCLHGKFGSIDRGQGWTRAVDNGVPTLDVAVISYASMIRYIVEANKPGYAVDVFGHSWTPEMGAAVDALYGPKASLHEKEERRRNADLCNQIRMRLTQLTQALGIAPFMRFGPVGRGSDSCERTASHLLGMQRTINLKAIYESKNGFKYDVVMVSRWDVTWNRPFLFSRMDLSGNAFLLSTYCTHEHHIDRRSALEKNMTEFKTAVCGGRHTRTQVPTASQSCHPEHRPCSGDLSDRARELYLLDWWFVSSSRSADGFALVAEPQLYANYTLLNQQRLNNPKHGRPVIMGHAFWGMHMVWGLHAKLRFVASISTDFNLGRVWKRDGACRGIAAKCHGPSCDGTDVIRRPWHAETGLAKFGSTFPQRKPPVFKYGAEQTRDSCGAGQFNCVLKSRMCAEEMLTWEPMDHTHYRKAWIDCTGGLCTRLGFPAYSVRCAGALLGMWAMLWKSATIDPANTANTTLEVELANAGALSEGFAIGVHEPHHAAAALSYLLKHSGALLHSPTYKGSPIRLAEAVSTCPNITLSSRASERIAAGESTPA